MMNSPVVSRTQEPHSGVSVVMCTCNGERWLEEQLASIEQQTLLPDEVVIGDDASRDGTYGLLQDFSRRMPFPVHLTRHDPPLGVVENFEFTLSRARGKYVAFADQDDIWLPERLERGVAAIQALEGNGDVPVLSHADLILMDAEGRDLGRRFLATRGLDAQPRDPLRVLLRHNLVTGCSVTINRALIERARPFPENLVMHDWWLALVAAAIGKITLMDEPLVRYRQHDHNVVGAPPLVSATGLSRVLSVTSARQALAAVYRQDLELGNLLGDELPPDIQRFIEAIPHGGWKLYRAAARAGIRPQGILRRIRFLFETIGSGYRRHL